MLATRKPLQYIIYNVKIGSVLLFTDPIFYSISQVYYSIVLCFSIAIGGICFVFFHLKNQMLTTFTAHELHLRQRIQSIENRIEKRKSILKEYNFETYNLPEIFCKLS